MTIDEITWRSLEKERKRLQWQLSRPITPDDEKMLREWLQQIREAKTDIANKYLLNPLPFTLYPLP